MKGTKMNGIKTYLQIETGSPQFRINEVTTDDAPEYFVYSQQNLLDDLSQTKHPETNDKVIKTMDEVCLAKEGDVVYSLISGKAGIVNESHDGFLLTQNYIKLIPNNLINRKYLVYILNENREVKRQLFASSQGSIVIKLTLRQVRNLKLPVIADLNEQKLIGDIYLNQLRLENLQLERAKLNKTLVLQQLKEANNGR